MINPDEPVCRLPDESPGPSRLEELAFPFGPSQPGPGSAIASRGNDSSPQVAIGILARYLEAVGVIDAVSAADRLLREFGSLSDVLAAPRWRLRRVAGPRVGQVIRASQNLMKARLLEEVSNLPILPPYRDLVDLLQLEIGFLCHERLVAVYLDGISRLLRIETIAEGFLSEVPINVRKILTIGLGLEASGFLLVHNHPSGIPVPSQSDLAVTAHLRQLGKEMGLKLVDHLIVARGRVGSIEEYWRDARLQGSLAATDLV